MADTRPPFPGFPQGGPNGMPAATPQMGMASFYSSPEDVNTSLDRSKKRRRRLIVGGGVLAVLLLLGGGSAWAVTGHGDYPYQHLSASVTGYAQLNLDPSMLEKMQVSSFLSKIPKVDGKDIQQDSTKPDAVAKALVSTLAPGNSISDYSWAGDRYGIAAVGDSSNWSTPGNLVILMQTKDTDKALKSLNSAFSPVSAGGFSTSSLVARSVGGGYVAVGTDSGITGATGVSAQNPTDSPAAKLTDAPTFKDNYTGAADPASYWITAEGQVATGSLAADWGGLNFNAKAVGPSVKITTAEQEENRTLTASNSVADPILNLGMAQPGKLFGPDSVTGQQLIKALSAYATGPADSDTSKQLETALAAMGDNVSISVNNDGGRLLLHNGSEQQLNAALTKLTGQKTSIRELLSGSNSQGQKVGVQKTADGLLFTFGADNTASPTDLSKVDAGALVMKFDIDALPKELFGNTTGKWGTVSLSTVAVDDGTETHAKWELP